MNTYRILLTPEDRYYVQKKSKIPYLWVTHCVSVRFYERVRKLPEYFDSLEQAIEWVTSEKKEKFKKKEKDVIVKFLTEDMEANKNITDK